jgi:hypothetical protein
LLDLDVQHVAEIAWRFDRDDKSQPWLDLTGRSDPAQSFALHSLSIYRADGDPSHYRVHPILRQVAVIHAGERLGTGHLAVAFSARGSSSAARTHPIDASLRRRVTWQGFYQMLDSTWLHLLDKLLVE